MNRLLIGTQVAKLPEHVEAELSVPAQTPPALAACCAFNRWGSMLAVGCRQGDVLIYDMMTRGVACRLSHEQVYGSPAVGPVTALAFNRSGKFLIAGYTNGAVVKWDVSTRSVASQVDGYREVLGVSISETTEPTIVVAFAKGPPCVWGDTLQPLFADGLVDSRLFACVHRQKRFIVVGLDKQGTIFLLDPETRHVIDAIQVAPFKNMSLSHCGTTILLPGAACVRGIKIQRDGAGASATGSIEWPAALQAMAQKKSGTTLRSLSAEVPAFANSEPMFLPDISEFRDPVNTQKWSNASLSRDGEYVVGSAIVRDEHIMHIWEAHGGHMALVLEGPKIGLQSCCWSPNTTRMTLVSITSRGAVFIWAHIMSQNWSAYAPGFRELTENEIYEESETEFDLNAKESDNDLGTDDLPKEIECVMIPKQHRFMFDSDTEEDMKTAVMLPPLQITPNVPVTHEAHVTASTPGVSASEDMDPVELDTDKRQRIE